MFGSAPLPVKRCRGEKKKNSLWPGERVLPSTDSDRDSSDIEDTIDYRSNGMPTLHSLDRVSREILRTFSDRRGRMPEETVRDTFVGVSPRESHNDHRSVVDATRSNFSAIGDNSDRDIGVAIANRRSLANRRSNRSIARDDPPNTTDTTRPSAIDRAFVHNRFSFVQCRSSWNASVDR